MDLFHGGSRYQPIRAIGGYGLGTAADSLSAIRRFVYQDGLLTLQEMREALEADYAGHSELQALLREQTPCWGNDNEEADRIARRVFNAYADAVHGLNDGSLPGKFVTSVFSYTRHVYAGEMIAATPNGRNRGAPLSETIGPSQGRDVQGPTALLKSVTKLDPDKITGASALNVKFSASLLAGAEGSAALKSLIKTYLELGGAQMQVNFVDQAVLQDARAHPDRHRNLVVRVAGFSEYFTNLDRALQDEIISRASHGA
ncbi:MAG: pyruvate formate lyase family protein [Candidatus Brocadiia bacterium]